MPAIPTQEIYFEHTISYLTHIPFRISFLPDCEQEHFHAPCILYRNDNLEVKLICVTE